MRVKCVYCGYGSCRTEEFVGSSRTVGIYPEPEVGEKAMKLSNNFYRSILRALLLVNH
jgi:hypothetical protein